MLRILCVAIPVLVLLLPLFMEASVVWILNILLTLLGTIFSYINYNYRKDKIGLAVLIVNGILFLYYVYAMINFFV
ncbi:hypothetical protein JEOAER750_02169 [Jeotgalicoccus aerolatus]|jgi:hypothetical protein|uniref:Uncharacterized protein n=1 Tax=Jeotgalicoccus aerolatus TaxID=709510 RepID=A0A1G8Y8Y6_9STAP|nr:hypothetical protein [Jeotgalicoccus aerolatus]MBP1952733.1 hypothetical protein [Jeotgalicoccus aerolatus]NMA80660.1 hypothetical protein [Jeotgalicoccus aerolatus]CAD2080897.1 hypothetical protein JEOAER750_02169 [Jeotgalicoccus aerolatus]SDJ98874.1 hypothetical protein SAMN05216187_10427 [Jeotgalicoccus aerolatus]GGE08613.1 hypothetical protein GCM10007273_21150 [Jeotgalicoccus aerolatus]